MCRRNKLRIAVRFCDCPLRVVTGFSAADHLINGSATAIAHVREVEYSGVIGAVEDGLKKNSLEPKP